MRKTGLTATSLLTVALLLVFLFGYGGCHRPEQEPDGPVPPPVLKGVIKLSEDLTLYSGDIITLRADDGTFLKRFDWLDGHSALVCYQDEPDFYSYFMVEVVPANADDLQPNRVLLTDDNGRYLKRYCCWQGKSIISMDKDTPDIYSDFLLTPKGGNQITLQAENGEFLKRFFGYEGMSVITCTPEEESPYGTFRVSREDPPRDWKGAANWEEVVEDFQFDLTQLRKGTTPKVIGSQTLRNDSSEEQAMEFHVSHTVETEKSFEWDYSFKIGAETKFKAKIPLLGENETTINVETGFTKGGSESETESKTVDQIFPVTCPPKTTLLATAMVQIGKVDVPYTARIIRKRTDRPDEEGYTYQVKGTFHGTSAFDVGYHIKPVEVER